MRNLKLVGKGLGYRIFHNVYAVGSDKGYPDLHFLGFGLSLFIEAKGPKWKIYPEQTEWIETLRAMHDITGGVVVASFAWPRDYDQVCSLLEGRYQLWMNFPSVPY